MKRQFLDYIRAVDNDNNDDSNSEERDDRHEVQHSHLHIIILILLDGNIHIDVCKVQNLYQYF